jgi:hypothetical protein
MAEDNDLTQGRPERQTPARNPNWRDRDSLAAPVDGNRPRINLLRRTLPLPQLDDAQRAAVEQAKEELAEEEKTAQQPTQQAPQPATQAATQPVAPQATPRTERTFNPERREANLGIVQDSEVFKPGLVISFPLLSLDAPADGFVESRELTLTNNGYWVYTKVRNFIIIQTYYLHCVAIPVSSRGGEGVQGLNSQDEYIGVRSTQDLDPLPSDSKHENILVRPAPEWRSALPNTFHYMQPSSHAYFTFPVCFLYNRKCQIEGQVHLREHLDRLIKLYYADAPKPKRVRNNNRAKEEKDDKPSGT